MVYNKTLDGPVNGSGIFRTAFNDTTDVCIIIMFELGSQKMCSEKAGSIDQMRNRVKN